MRSLDEKLAGMPEAYGILFTEEDKIIYAPFVQRRRADAFFKIEEKLLVEDLCSGSPIVYLELDNEKDEVYYSTNEEIEVHNTTPWIDEDGYVEDIGSTSYFELHCLFKKEVIDTGMLPEPRINTQILLPGGSILGCKNLYFLDLNGRKIRGTEGTKETSEVFLLECNEKYAHVAYTRPFDLDKKGLNRIYTARIELANRTAETRHLISGIDSWAILMKTVESRIIDMRLRRLADSLK